MPFLPFGLLGFALFGVMLVLVGASQDEIRAALALDLAAAGGLVSAVMAGIGVGVLLGGPLVDRWPRRPLFCAAAAATGLSLCAISPDLGFWSVFALLAVAGAGGGFFETILNAVAIERYGERSVRALATLHSAASVGAMTAPLAIGWAVHAVAGSDWTLAFRVTGVAHLALALLAWTASLGAPSRAAAPDRAAAPAAAQRSVLTRPLVLLCLAAFAYVGVESALTGLAIPYTQGALGLPADRGRSAISLFWLGLLAGRIAFALRARSVDDARAATRMGAAAALAIGVGVAVSWSAVEVLFAGIGFVLGGVFPLLVAIAGRRTPQAPATAVAVVAGLGSAGGFAIPWLTGLLGDRTGIGFAVGTLAAWSATIAVAAALAERRRVTR